MESLKKERRWRMNKEKVRRIKRRTGEMGAKLPTLKKRKVKIIANGRTEPDSKKKRL